MIDSRFINLYQTLSKAELRELKKWVHSPAHNQHKDVVKLYDFLESRQKISAITVQKKRAFQYIFGDETYDEYKFNILMTYSLDVLKEFIGYNQAVSSDFGLKKNLVSSLKNRKIPHLASLELEKIKEKNKKNPLLNAEKMLQTYELEVEQFEILGVEARMVQTNLPELFNSLTDFYCISMLKYACEAISHSNVTKQVYHIPLLEELLLFAKKSAHPIVLLYYNAYQTLKTEEVSYFGATESLFLAQNQKLNIKEQRDVLLILINYSIKRVNTDAQSSSQKAFDWYKWGLEHHILLQDNALSRFAFSNIASLGLKLKEFDWVDMFIQKYASFLPEKYRSNYVHYNTAKLYFNKKDYDNAQKLLITVEYDDILLNLDSKTMLLEIYYEEKSWKALDALLVSFSRFLHRKSVLSYHKKNYQNIIKFTHKILELRPSDKKAKQALLKAIQETQPLTERNWLLTQINLLM